MKKTIRRRAGKSHRAGRLRGSLAALLAGLTLLAGTTLVMHAQLIEEPQNSLLLSWPEPTEEQTVVGSSSLASNAVWTPWPEPIFKRLGQLCMTVPIDMNQREQYFKLVPGRQFFDDYANLSLPYTNHLVYSNWVGVTSGFDFQITNGTYRITRHGPGPGDWDGGASMPMPFVVVRDFSASVDLLDWSVTNTGWTTFFMAGRGRWVDLRGDFGGLVMSNPLRTIELHTVVNGTEVWGPSFNMQQHPPPYRLQFSVVGRNLSFRVMSLTTGELLGQMKGTDTTLTEGFMGYWISNASLPASGSYAITLDNFFVTGTTR